MPSGGGAAMMPFISLVSDDDETEKGQGVLVHVSASTDGGGSSSGVVAKDLAFWGPWLAGPAAIIRDPGPRHQLPYSTGDDALRVLYPHVGHGDVRQGLPEGEVWRSLLRGSPHTRGPTTADGQLDEESRASYYLRRRCASCGCQPKDLGPRTYYCK